MDNKVILEAILTLRSLPESKRKEYASVLNLPENDQKDIMFMSAILVSTGTNKNGATFLGSELIKARGTIAGKPLDIEHKEDQIIGHICSSLYLDHTGEVIEDAELYNKIETATEDKDKVIAELDKMDMDIGIVCAVYKDRFPELAKEIQDGEWKVSMECYYDDFDVKVGNMIIPKENVASHQDYIEKLSLGEAVKLVIAGKEVGNYKASRVLRGVRFCGVGIVKNPAEDRAIVLEAANYMHKTLDRENMAEDLKEAATIEVDKEEAVKESPLSEDSTAGEVVQSEVTGYVLLKDGIIVPDSFSNDYNKVQEEAIRRTSLESKGHYTVATLNSSFTPREKVEINDTSEAVIYKTNEVGDVKEILAVSSNKESAYIANRWGPEQQSAGICVNFRKYLYEKHGRPNQGKVLATHWCKLFEKPCPVVGADAHDRACLRNKFGTYTRQDHIHGDKINPVAYNPTIPAQDVQVLEFDERPMADQNEDSVEFETPVPKDVVGEEYVVNTEEVEPITPTRDAPPAGPTEGAAVLSNLPKLLAKLSINERKVLASRQFGLQTSRKYPIHTAELVEETMKAYKELAKDLDSYIDKRELFNNLIVAALKKGISTKEFEKANIFAFRAGKEYDETYGIPRLKLFPLDSRQQVIAAMSRFDTIKADISQEEKERLVVNILRAAAKFEIDTGRFRDRVLEKE